MPTDSDADTQSPGPSEALEAAIAQVQEKLQHPDLWKRALTSYVISEWMTAVVESGAATAHFALPITSTSRETRNSKDDDGSSLSCHDNSITILGHHIVTWGTCVQAVGTGTAHLDAEVLSVGLAEP
jgi:hypothetical protein